ncbi:MAG TPA: peptidoglycan recognition family protein [Blastocatellia bacterium]|nr:peptidoglycan recognition family protein [Blastocatellia bacterium]
MTVLSTMLESKAHDPEYAKLVDQYSRYLDSPVLRLKFLNIAFKEERKLRRLERMLVVGTLHDRARLVFELSKLLPLGKKVPLALRITAFLNRLRYVVWAVCLAGVIAGGVGVIFLASKLVGSLSVSTQAKGIAGESEPARSGESGARAVGAIGSEAGLSLDKVWLAEQGDAFEFYSNGARVLTEYETEGRERKFFQFTVDGLRGNARNDPSLLSKPVGIVYHVSESDLLPFADRYNASLINRSRSLLDYARENKLYNYVIDRFGRIYRIVRDEDAASHAGNSMWSDGKNVYVNLSASFIGVCFEGKSGQETVVGPDAINEAQIYAARALTLVLRSKYAIEDANCVTHGLVSVNPSNKLMGYHTDWVAGFPFEAIGLTNKYESELLAVSRFGFGYDESYVAAAGGNKWPGLARADAAVVDAARKKGLPIAEERRAGWNAFQLAYAKQHAMDQVK